MKKKTTDFVSLMTDFVFKLVFGVQKNIANIEAFLKAVLDLPPEEYEGLTIKNPFLNRFRKKGKQAILDLKLGTKTPQQASHRSLSPRETAYVSLPSFSLSSVDPFLSSSVPVDFHRRAVYYHLLLLEA